MRKRKRAVFLFSDTGGGHRSAAEAIIEALEMDYDGAVDTEMLDVFKEYAPPPLDHVPEAYPALVKVPSAWGLGFRLSNGERRGRALTAAFWPYVRSAVKRIVTEHPADVIVSVHPLFTAPILRAFGERHPPFVTVVTDLVTGHALWYNRNVEVCAVPTDEAKQKALEYGLGPWQVKVVGLPVAHKFCQPSQDVVSLRHSMGWPVDRPMVLLVGGGEGMGPIYETARAIARQRGDFGLAVVAGRNRSLKRRLEAAHWPVPTFIYGFVHKMPDLMQAATLLVTKAGPGTITEALNAGLPMVLYSRLPGQEDGNVGYVVDKGVGVWAPGPGPAAAAVRRWLEKPGALNKASATCRQIAKPDASKRIAELIVSQIEPGQTTFAQGVGPTQLKSGHQSSPNTP